MAIPRLATICLAVWMLSTAKGQQTLSSPCPSIFHYENGNSESDRWYGSMTLSSDAELKGIWLKLLLDRASEQLGNWFGDVTRDGKEYLITNKNFTLKPDSPLRLRFYIKYDVNEPVPQLVGIRLNAKTICPEAASTTPEPTTAGILRTSARLSTTQPSTRIYFTNIGTRFNSDVTKPDDEDEFFQGDLRAAKHPRFGGVNDNLACGTVVMRPTPLITHGQATREGEFPWHAALYHAKGIDLTYICGASLISRNYIITVAHCVTKRKSANPLDPDNLIVYFGKYYLKKWSSPGIQDRYARNIIVHDDYNPQTYSNDIALVELTSKVDITDYVRPVCLWDENTELNAIIDKAGTVAGWGFDETGHVTEQLTQAKMPVVSQETCIYSFPDFFSRFTNSKTFCAGYRNDNNSGTSVCNGDSGGGLVFPKSNIATGSPIWHIRGLVSISVALQNQFKCDSNHYVVFTDVAKHLDWIKKILSK